MIKTPTTFTNLVTLSDNFSNEDVCRKYLEHVIWNGKPVCPHCRSYKVYTFKNGKGYKCAENKCYKLFNVKVGTFLEGTKLPLRKWFHALYLFTSHKKGISSHQLAKDLGITQKSAWFLLGRLREVLKEKTPFQLEKAVEIDHSYVGGKISNKHVSKRDVNSLSNKSVVLGIVQREGKLITHIVPDAKAENTVPIMQKTVKKGSTLLTDSANSFIALRKDYSHASVNHEIDEYVRGDFHTNTIEGFFSHLKRGIIGIYHHASRKHIHRYCNEFSFRYNTRKLKEVERFDVALKQSFGRLTYQQLIEDKK